MQKENNKVIPENTNVMSTVDMSLLSSAKCNREAPWRCVLMLVPLESMDGSGISQDSLEFCRALIVGN